MDEVRFSRWQKRVLMFFVSQSITLFGSTLVQMALVWYATMQTASGRWVAAFSVCSYLPQFLMAFVGGVWADRYSHKRLIIAADAVTAGLTLAMVGLMPLFTSEAKLLAALLVLSLLRAVAAGVQTPAVNAAVPQMVPKHALLRVNGINASMQAVVNFAAPAAAGAVMAFGSLRAILMIDVVTAAAGISLLAVLAKASNREGRYSALAKHVDRSEGGVFQARPAPASVGLRRFHILLCTGRFSCWFVCAAHLWRQLLDSDGGRACWFCGHAGWRCAYEYLGWLSKSLAHTDGEPLYFWRMCRLDGCGDTVYGVPRSDGALWHCHDQHTDGDNHPPAGAGAAKTARPHPRPTEQYVCWRFAAWNGGLWAACRSLSAFAVDGVFRTGSDRSGAAFVAVRR